MSFGTDEAYLSCGVCFTAHVQVAYARTKDEQDASYFQHASVSKSCGRDGPNCYNYLNTYRVGSSRHECYYDPSNTAEVVWQKGYTWWYWVLTSIPMGSLLVIFMGMSYESLDSVTQWDGRAYPMQIMLWGMFLFPVIFFLPLATCVYIDYYGRLACIVLGSIMAASIGVYGLFLYTTDGLEELEACKTHETYRTVGGLSSDPDPDPDSDRIGGGVSLDRWVESPFRYHPNSALHGLFQ